MSASASEMWAPCPGFHPYYIVSSWGRVRNIDTGKLLFGEIDRDGYRRVNLRLHGKTLKRRVHRLVCEAFHGPAPAGYEVCHGDGKRLNNRADNLRWGTRSDNVRDAIRHGTHYGDMTEAFAAIHGKRSGHNSPNAKFQPAQVAAIRKRSADGASGYVIAREFGCSPRAIHRIVSEETYCEH